MSIIKDAMQWLMDRGEVTLSPEHDVWIGGGQCNLLPRRPTNMPNTIHTSSLESLVRYCECAQEIGDIEDISKHLVYVAGPQRVSLVGPLNKLRERESIMEAEWPPTNFPDPMTMLGQKRRPHIWAEWLGRHCEPGGDRDRLIGLLQNIRIKDAVVQKAEGLGWRAAAEKEVGGEGWEQVEGPVPTFTVGLHATFPEIAFHPEVQLTVARPEVIGDHEVVVRIEELNPGAWIPETLSHLRSYLTDNFSLLNQPMPTVL